MNDEIEIIKDEDVEVVEQRVIPAKHESPLARASRGAGRVVFEDESAQTDLLAAQMMGQVVPPWILGKTLVAVDSSGDHETGNQWFHLRFSDGTTLKFLAREWSYE